MIVAQTQDGRHHKVDGLANRGEWFSDTWLVACNIGVFCYKIVVEAEHEAAAIDALADSNLSNLIDTDIVCQYCEREEYDLCECERAGNDSHTIDLSYCGIMGRCKVLYFERPDNWDGITEWGGYLERVTA